MPESSPQRRLPPSLLLALTLVLVAAPIAAAPGDVTVQIAADVADDSLRLVLTHSERTPFVIEDTSHRLTIRYSTAVSVEPRQMKFEGRIVERLRQRDEFTLVLDLGRDYQRFETFELRNPFRVVLDVSGKAKAAQRGRRPRSGEPPRKIIVLDAGHGGIEEGAVGPTGLREKDVTLRLARRLKQSLRLADPSISVVLTRDEDRLLSLDERTSIANHNKADLFISIHLNASPRRVATGAETYFLSTRATDDEARTLAALENRAFDPEGPTSAESGADGDGDALELVLWDMAQNRYLAESSALALSIQGHMNRLTGTRDRGIRQAPFRVLMGATMPAVLVEAGFISNPEEELRFQSSQYLGWVVDALTEAIGEFLADLDRAQGAAPASAGSARR